MTMSAKLLVLRAVLIVWHAGRTRRRKLERELAAFATPAERSELEAILSRYTAEETREVWSIVNRQALPAR